MTTLMVYGNCKGTLDGNHLCIEADIPAEPLSDTHSGNKLYIQGAATHKEGGRKWKLNIQWYEVIAK